jgi:adenylylsulfate kinase
MKEGDFIEIFVDAPIEVCEKRDPKGLYKKARAGELKGFTGIDDPYEPPAKPELVLDAGKKDAETLADEVIAFLQRTGKIR